ncbi:MAG: hypothetical protein WEB04_06685 [Dehalococcoidia bacterium]
MRASLAVILASLIIGVAIACGGGASNNAPTATAPVVTPAPIATGEPGPTPEPAFQSFAYEVQFVAAIESASSQPITSIERRAEGLFQAPGSHAFGGGLGVVGQTPGHQAVVIGDQAWYREGDGAWQQITTTAFLQLGASALTSAQPGFLNETAFEGKLEGLDFTTEESAGVTAHKYSVPADEVNRIGSLLRIAFIQDISQLENVVLTAWTSEETGALVRFELSTLAPPAAVLGQVPENIPADAKARVTLHVELSRINDSSIRISPPI